MKPFIAAALCATALTAAAPALAQYGPPPPPNGPVQPGHDLRGQLDALGRRIQDGIRDGRIDRGEADRAIGELGRIRDAEDQMRARSGGELNDIDRGVLQGRIDHLSASIHWMNEHGPVAPPVVIAPPPPRPIGPPSPPAAGAWTLDQREAWMQQRINQARGDHSLTPSEIYRAQKGLNDIKSLQARMIRHNYGTLRDVDRAYLEQRLDHLRDAIRWFHDVNNAPPWARP